jgi:hypothetical protein
LGLTCFFFPPTEQWFKVQVEDEKMLLDHSDQDADDVPLIDNVLFSDFQKSLILMQSATIA